MDEQFRKAEEEYFILRGKFDTGRIGKNLFELALKDMAVQDTQGRWTSRRHGRTTFTMASLSCRQSVSSGG
jgi:hypothetical protein